MENNRGLPLRDKHRGDGRWSWSCAGRGRSPSPGGAPRAPPPGGAGRGPAGCAGPSSGRERCRDVLGKAAGKARRSRTESRCVAGRLLPAVRAGAGRGGGGQSAVRSAVRDARGAVRDARDAARGAECGAGCAAAVRGVRFAGCAGAVRGVWSAVRNPPACDARCAGCGARDAVRGSPRPGRPGDAAACRGRRRGRARTREGFLAGCSGTISAGGCVSRGRTPLAEHWAALPAPALNPAVPAGEWESGGKRVK